MAALGFDSGLLVTLVGLPIALVAVGLTLGFNAQKYVIIVITVLTGANLIVLMIEEVRPTASNQIIRSPSFVFRRSSQIRNHA